MAEYPHSYLQVLSDALDAEVGEADRRILLAGTEEMTSKTAKTRQIEAFREVMARMDAHPNREALVRARVACACKPQSFLKDAKKIMAESPTLEAFVNAVQKRRYLGMPLSLEQGPEGGRIHGVFGFQRCVCGKVGKSTKPLTMMWCECCRGHIIWMWQNLLQRPVKVDLYEAAIAGADDCRYTVDF